MPAMRDHIQAYVQRPEKQRLQREAAARGISVSQCVIDCLREYFAWREEMAAAIDSIRDVARGLYPKILETGGLKPALSGLARRLPMPVRVSVISERLPREIEGVIYFCCSEALQNVAKHSSAEHVVLSVSRDRERVCLEVSDDGVGLSPRPESAGRGVQNMRDRIEAIDGEFELRVHPLGGTVVRASIPVPVTPPGR